MKEGRSTVYNQITSDEKLKLVNKENIELEQDFIEYLITVDRSSETIKQYKSALHIFWCWNLDENNNTSFVNLTKRQITRFQNFAINEYGWSPRRVRMVKSVMRSLENYVLNILDDDYPDYRKIWDKIENPVNVAVREKSVFTKEELQPLLDYLVEKKEFEKACLLALAMYSGRRKAELPRFKISYFDESNLICEGALYKTPEKIKTKGRGKSGKLLTCYTLAKSFKPYFDMWMEEREKLGVVSEWLFPVCKGGKWLDAPIATTTIDSWFRTFSAFLGKILYPHSLRHHFTSALSESGIPDNVIKDIVGWSDVGMVDVYRDIEAEDTFDKYFGAEGIKKVEQKGLADL